MIDNNKATECEISSSGSHSVEYNLYINETNKSEIHILMVERENIDKYIYQNYHQEAVVKQDHIIKWKFLPYIFQAGINTPIHCFITANGKARANEATQVFRKHSSISQFRSH